MSIDRPDSTWWQASDGRWYPPAPPQQTAEQSRRTWPWRVRLALVAIALGIVGFTIYNDGTGDQALGAMTTSCDITESIGYLPTSSQQATCDEQRSAGEGKILAGQIIMGLGALGLVAVFVSGGRSA